MNVDFSVFKSFMFKERYSAQFRVEFFNLFNHPVLANPTAGWLTQPSATTRRFLKRSAAGAPRPTS
jgi:hypothetical protein